MSNRIRPFDIAGKFQNAHRRRYTCPFCSEVFQQEPKIWEHAVQTHRDSLGDIESIGAAEAVRKNFRQDSLDKAQNEASRTAKAAADPPSTPSFKDDITTSSPIRSSSAPGYDQKPRKKIDDIGALTLGQEQLTEPQDRPIPRNNPLKRGAGDHSRSPEPVAGGHTAGSMTSRARHGRNHSGKVSIGKDSDFNRQRQLGSDPEPVRPRSDPNHRVWDPNTDDPYAAKNIRREKFQVHPNTGRRFNPPREHSVPPRNPHSEEKAGWPPEPERTQDYPVLHQSNFDQRENAKRPIILEKGRDPSSDESSPPVDEPESPETEPEMLLQPETRPISQAQLVQSHPYYFIRRRQDESGLTNKQVVEVKGIYAGLVMVEAKCIDIDERQSATAQERDPLKRISLKDDQWQSLIALHKQLLHEHHDFFLASQHPSASDALSRLAAKYSMPARMWRHGIHAFLEVLRHRLPESLEHMLAFIYIAYSMMALLYETVSTFEDTWIECLGDLGRYRMAIEDDEPKDREVWSGVARFWYNKAADKSPTVGRLYHHLAILARPYTLEQLSLYTRSLTCVTPFESAKGSILTLFNPVLSGKESHYRRSNSLETTFIKAHGLLFTRNPGDPFDQFDECVRQLDDQGLLEKYIGKATARFKETGVHAAVSNIAALFEYGGGSKQGISHSFFRTAFENARMTREEASRPPPEKPTDPLNLPPSAGPPKPGFHSLEALTTESSLIISHASKLTFMTLRISLKHHDPRHVYPLVLVYLVFIWSLISVDSAMKAIEQDVPWCEVCASLNVLSPKYRATISELRITGFPNQDKLSEADKKEALKPLAEDFVLRGQIYTQYYFPETWFMDAMVDDDERSLDPPSRAEYREKRVLSLGLRIAAAERWIRYDSESNYFSPTEYAKEYLGVLAQETGATVKSESRPNDQDSIMADVVPAEDTSRDISLAPSDFHDDSKDSTRASTPVDTHAGSLPDEPPSTPKIQYVDEAPHDVPMMDISPGKNEQDTFQGISVPPIWSPGTIIRSGTPPPKKPFKSEFLSGLEKLRSLTQYDDQDTDESGLNKA